MYGARNSLDFVLVRPRILWVRPCLGICTTCADVFKWLFLLLLNLANVTTKRRGNVARKLRPPSLNCAAAFYLAPIYTLRWLASVWNESCNNFRSSLINTLGRSVETLSCIRFKSELCQTTDVDIRFTMTCCRLICSVLKSRNIKVRRHKPAT